MLTIQDFKELKTKEGFINLLKAKQPEEQFKDTLNTLDYEKELKMLQAELVDLQQWVAKHK